MEKLSFYKLILEAWYATFTRKLPWIFGSFVAISALIESRTNTDITRASSFEGLFQAITEKSPQELWFIFIVLFILFVLNIAGKGNLIVSLSFMVKKERLAHHPTTAQALWKNFISSFFLECIALFFLVAIIGILSLPLLIASGTNKEALPILLNFAVITFIPLALIVSLIEQFAFLYLLLSPLPIRPAIETGSALFSRFIVRSFFFIFLTLLLTLLFTFFANLVILGIAALSEKISLPLGGPVTTSTISLALFTWFALFLQALWITFFKSIALPQEPEKVATEKEVEMSRDALPEIPPAQ